MPGISRDFADERHYFIAPENDCRAGKGFSRTDEGIRTYCVVHDEYHLEPDGWVNLKSGSGGD